MSEASMAQRPQNAFLLSLSERTFSALSKDMVAVDLALGTTLANLGDEITHVFFPVTSLLSMLKRDDQGETLETFMTGREGAAGLLEACGSGRASTEIIVQVDGHVHLVTAAAIRRLLASDADFVARAMHHIEQQMAESRQSALCLAFHALEQRLARWLADGHERSGGRNPLPLTQEFMASMLGVQRTTVSAIAGILQKQGVIRYSRGQVTIVDADALERRACECRTELAAERLRLGFPVPGSSGVNTIRLVK